MKDWPYRLSPVIFSVTGFVIIICLFYLHDYLYAHWQWVFWLIVSLINIFFSVALGVFVNRLRQSVNKDLLTGLHNRRGFYERMGYEIGKMKRSKLPLSLAIIDIDNFRTINDTYGHLEGDKVLTDLAGIFKTQALSGDTFVRWGGDEFVMILPETDKSGALAFAERIRELVEFSNCKYKITICIGVTTVYQENDVEKIMSIADRALYKAKENKNSVVLFTE